MKEEPFNVNYISIKDCFLHLPEQCLSNLTNSDENKCLKIQYGDSKCAYLSWCSQPFTMGENHCIGLNATYAQILGIEDKEEVLISSCSNVSSVSKIYVRLLTSEEWEIMEANVHAVQSSLLDQIRVVWPGQTLVVWVSKYLHFLLHVDAIEPNYKVGILEPYTDLAVVIPNEDAASESLTVNHLPQPAQPVNLDIGAEQISPKQEDIKNGDYDVQHENNELYRSFSSEIWNTIKQLFFPNVPVKTDQQPLSHDFNNTERTLNSSSDGLSSKQLFWNNTSIPYRVHPLPRLKPNTELTRSSECLLNHPFNVFIHRCNLPSKFACVNDQAICRLAKCTSINSKDEDKHSKDANNDTSEGISGSASTRQKLVCSIYAQIFVIEDIYGDLSVETKEQFKLAASYSEHCCILVSSTVYRCLNLKTGSRINVSFEACKSEPLTSIKITPFGKWKEDKNGIKSIFQDYLTRLTMYRHTNLVLNSNIVISVEAEPTLHNEVLVQLLPQELNYAILDGETLSKCNIDVAECSSLGKALVDIVSEESKGADDSSRLATYFGCGMRRLVTEGLTALEMSLCLEPSFYGPHNVNFHLTSNVLIFGKLGSGKTTLAHYLCIEVKKPPYYVHCVTIQCKPLKGKKVDTIHKMLMQWVNECIFHQPSVLLLDDVEAIAGTSTSEENFAEKAYFFRIGDMLASTLEKVQSQNYVVVVATAPSISKLSPAVAAPRGQHFFKTLLDIPDLSRSDRLETMKALISQKSGLSSEDLQNLDLNSHATKAEGYVIQDIADMVDKAIFEGWKRTYAKSKDLQNGMALKACDVAEAMSNNVPLSLRGVTLHKDSTHTWADVGGLTEVKRELIEVLQWPSQYMDLFSKCPLRHQSGLLLYGAPGTGKTLLAAAVSHECGLNFISVKGPELLSKYIGASEEAVRNIFQKAQSARPCVLFFDEFDSLAPRRGHDSTGVTDRVVNQLLTQLDGVESLTGVWVVAATSRPDLLDPALLRPGRLDKAVLCSLPDTADRTDILRALSRKLILAPGVDLEAIARKSEGFTGADLQAVLYTAQLMSVEEQQKQLVSAGASTSRPVEGEVVGTVTQAHLQAALADTRPSLPPGEKLRYQTIYNTFIGARKGKSRDLQIVSQRATLA